MKHTLFTLLLLCTVTAFSQVITVKDSDSEQPIEMATLMSGNGKLFAATDAKGQADVSAFKDAEKIEFRSLGYKTILKSYQELKTNSFQIELSGTNISLDAVVVSATRWNQESRDVPSKVVGISPRQAALQNPQTAADLLSISGKVFMQKSQQGGGSPIIRGFATNRLLYTVDGIRMNTAIFRGGNLQNVISLDPLAIESTEIFFGAGSVIYGSDAIGGVMSFRTLTPHVHPQVAPQRSLQAALQRQAAANKRGIWTGAFTKPWERQREKRLDPQQTTRLGCLIKGNINSKGDRIYHVTGLVNFPENLHHQRFGVAISRIIGDAAKALQSRRCPSFSRAISVFSAFPIFSHLRVETLSVQPAQNG